MLIVEINILNIKYCIGKSIDENPMIKDFIQADNNYYCI